MPLDELLLSFIAACGLFLIKKINKTKQKTTSREYHTLSYCKCWTRTHFSLLYYQTFYRVVH